MPRNSVLSESLSNDGQKIMPIGRSELGNHCPTCACQQSTALSKPAAELAIGAAEEAQVQAPSTSHHARASSPDTASTVSTTKAHHPHRPHRCTACHEAFTRRSSLTRHERIRHANAARVICPYADCQYHTRGFTRTDALSKHLKRRH